jgi:hypothetical protein
VLVYSSAIREARDIESAIKTTARESNAWLLVAPGAPIKVIRHCALGAAEHEAASWAVLFCLMDEVLQCDEFPRARLSFERALHFRAAPFASVGDTLKPVDEENRRDLSYCHLAFAIWTDFRSRHYRVCQVMTPPFARQRSGRAKKAHPGLGACQSEKLELEISPVALRQRLDHRLAAPIIHNFVRCLPIHNFVRCLPPRLAGVRVMRSAMVAGRVG